MKALIRKWSREEWRRFAYVCLGGILLLSFSTIYVTAVAVRQAQVIETLDSHLDLAYEKPTQ